MERNGWKTRTKTVINAEPKIDIPHQDHSEITLLWFKQLHIVYLPKCSIRSMFCNWNSKSIGFRWGKPPKKFALYQAYLLSLPTKQQTALGTSSCFKFSTKCEIRYNNDQYREHSSSKQNRFNSNEHANEEVNEHLSNVEEVCIAPQRTENSENISQ